MTRSLAALASAATVWIAIAPSVASAQSLSIDTTADLGPVVRDVYGVDLEFISHDVPEVAALARGTPIARFPGGDADGRFLWSSPDPGPCEVPWFVWESAAELAVTEDIGLFLETNLVRGSYTDSAAWVEDALVRGIRVPWVGIGNEPWGDFDAGFRTPETYAADVRAHADAIRAVAPDVGIVLAIGTFNEDAWNRAAVRMTADIIDAVDYHYYPNKEADADPLEVAAGADGIAPLLSRIRDMLEEEAGPRAGEIGIIFGEWDGAADPPRYPDPPEPGRSYALWSMADALFYGSALGEMLTNGVSAAFFYELQGYRFGAVSGNTPTACLTPDLRIRRPKELAVRLYREHFGDRLLSVSPNAIPTFFSDGPTNWDGFRGEAPYVRAYASLSTSGNTLHLIAVNRHPDDAISLDLQLVGFTPANNAHVWELAGDSITATNENTGGPFDWVHVTEHDLSLDSSAPRIELRAHSVSAIVITRAGSTPNVDAGPGNEDAGPDDEDGGTAADAGPGTDPEPGKDGGCGCTAGPTRSGGMTFTVLAFVALAIRRRRRNG